MIFFNLVIIEDVVANHNIMFRCMINTALCSGGHDKRSKFKGHSTHTTSILETNYT